VEATYFAAIAALFGLLVGGAKWVWQYVVADKDRQIAARDKEIEQLRAEIKGYAGDDRDLVSTLQRTIDALVAEKAAGKTETP
jgi:cell division protein FtsB